MAIWAINNTRPERAQKLSEAHASHLLKPLTKRNQNFRAETNFGDQCTALVFKRRKLSTRYCTGWCGPGTQVSCLLNGDSSGNPDPGKHSLQAGCKVLLLYCIFLFTSWKRQILVRMKKSSSLLDILELWNDEYNYIVKGHLQSLCHQRETIPCVHWCDGHASLWVWHLARNITNPSDVLKLPLQLNWKMAKNPTRADDSPRAGHPRMLEGALLRLRPVVACAVSPLSSSGLLTVAWVEFMHMDNAVPLSALSPPCFPLPIRSGQIKHISDRLEGKSRHEKNDQGVGPVRLEFT